MGTGWARSIKEKPAVIQVNLFAGNQYWFSLGATDKPPRRSSVSIFDELAQANRLRALSGRRLRPRRVFPRTPAALTLSRWKKSTGEPAAFCLLYSYK